ncbi:hypothetical protein PWT90_02360 [Aphanocladium album]|nr:hypothetical protein PWT90_02360 [Aphanocladium album]
MDTKAPRQGAFRAVGIESVPDSFFPLQDAAAPAKTTGSTKHSTQIWSNHFQGPRARTQLRAWSRVELPSQSTRNFSGTVMKRVGLPIPRATKATTIPLPVAPTNIERPKIAEDGMPTRRVLRRLDSYEASDEECQMEGKPLSNLEMAGLQLQAKADVAHCLKTCPTSTTQHEAQLRRAGRYVQTVPLKRRTGALVPSAGNRLSTYTDILELPKITPQFRVPSRRFSVLPRKQASSPTLSPIALFTPDQEPVTPAAVMEPPRSMSDAKSPTKRSPRHKSPPIKNDGPRISEPAVKLLPATTPKFEPSPIKPASPPPATPLGEGRNLRGSLATPSTFPKAAPFGTAFAGMQRHSALRPDAMPLRLSPIKLAATPCPTNRAVVPVEQLSPTKTKLSPAGTPTRTLAVEPATPRIFTNISYMSADVPSPIAFVATLFPDSPVKQFVELQSGTPQKPTSFDFGTTSPSFNSVTWLTNAEAMQRPVASMKKGSRRQSEPLVRNCLKTQNRRQTVSPTKLVFQADATTTGSDGLFSPVKKAAPPKTSSVDLRSLAPVLPRPQKTRESLNNGVSPAPRQSSNEVVNIDMRQNPDIFGTKAISLSLSPVLGAALPSIAEYEGAEEPAKLQLFSPSVDAKTRKDTESTAVQPSTDPNETATNETPISPETSVGGLGIFETLPASNSPLISIEECDGDVNTEPQVILPSPSPVTSARGSTAQKEQKLSPSPTLNLSFTPVNNRSPRAAEASVQQEESIPESPPTVTNETVETATVQSHDYDSPGRDYMREFIRRSRPKRPSTTEAGSPVGPTVKRQPLGEKSPNTESPSKTKRKLEKEHDQHESPLKKSSNTSPKKMRRYGKSSTKKPTVTENEEERTETLDIKVVTESAANVDDEEDNAEMDSNSRRSSRLRDQTHVQSAKSAIPTPIKIGRNSGPTLNSAVRSEQQDLTNQTRSNTRKNKGDSEYPAQFLARQAELAQSEFELVERESSSDREGRKTVNWSNPLAMYQEDPQDKEKDNKPKKTKLAKPKTVQMSGIAKPVTRAKTTADKERTARLAEHFGMVSNGTPAKPQRSTRSRMRI